MENGINCRRMRCRALKKYMNKNNNGYKAHDWLKLRFAYDTV